MTSRAVRRAHQAYKMEPTKQKLALIFRANERLAAQHSIDKHEKEGLIEALQLEKKKRSRGKKLNLLSEEDIGLQLFSPARIQAARLYQATKEAEEQQKKENIAEKKAQATAIREQKEAEKAVRALQLAAKRQMAQEEKARKAVEVQVRKELRAAQKKAKEAIAKAKKLAKVPNRPQKRAIAQVVQSNNDLLAKRAKVVTTTTSRGRAVRRPLHLDN